MTPKCNIGTSTYFARSGPDPRRGIDRSLRLAQIKFFYVLETLANFLLLADEACTQSCPLGPSLLRLFVYQVFTIFQGKLTHAQSQVVTLWGSGETRPWECFIGHRHKYSTICMVSQRILWRDQSPLCTLACGVDLFSDDTTHLRGQWGMVRLLFFSAPDLVVVPNTSLDIGELLARPHRLIALGCSKADFHIVVQNGPLRFYISPRLL
ncbi:Hypothetical predicted protein [Pelobates cultripes]|uniref:Uncharacterized protein n=1 Tax=Pelobates cultripes TaxID=61616 RepID=A0AAD1RZ82_PELCU|nr:Hypothetical predicted protein [Pelobates cultripes]